MQLFDLLKVYIKLILDFLSSIATFNLLIVLIYLIRDFIIKNFINFFAKFFI